MGEEELFNIIKKYIPLVERLPKEIKIEPIKISPLLNKKEEKLESRVNIKIKEKPKKSIEAKFEKKSLLFKKKDKKTSSFWKSFYSSQKNIEYGEAINPYKQTNMVYSYEGTDASSVFIPLLQTFYISDANKLNNINGVKISSVVSISYKDVYEVQRVGKMNLSHNNNYIDPEIMERYKLWSLFSFNFMKSVIMYNSIGS